jgi:hypothetical protein
MDKQQDKESSNSNSSVLGVEYREKHLWQIRLVS